MERVKAGCNVLTALVLLAGLVYSLHEYRAHRQATREGRSLELVKEFNSRDLVRARTRLKTEWAEAVPLLETAMNSSEQARAETYSQVILSMVDRWNQNDDIDMVFEFLDRVDSCIETGLCDTRVAMQYFEPRGTSLFNVYYPQICRLRAFWGDPGIWDGVQRRFSPHSVGRVCRDS